MGTTVDTDDFKFVTNEAKEDLQKGSVLGNIYSEHVHNLV